MRVAIVGTAFGESRCRMVSEAPGATLVAVCGRDAGRAAEVAARQGCQATTDLAALLARPDVDVVGVYSGTEAHTAIAVAAARAGKHVIVSKPTAVSVADGREMLSTAERAGVRLVVEFDTRYLAGAYQVYRAIAQGRLGSLIQGDYVNKTYRDQSYYDSDGGWRARAESGGGCVLNQGVHAVDHLLWYQGEVEGVFALSGTFAHQIPAEDAASAVLRFRNGSLATFTATTTFRSDLPAGRYGGGGTLKRAQVHGGDGSATVSGAEVDIVTAADAAAVIAAVTATESGVSAVDVPERPPINVFDDLAQTLADPARRSHTLVSGQDALQSVYVCAALRQSAASRRYVTIDEVRAG
ncbi:MAG: oxidoreductase-like protein [Frankiales bacterium]|nr:oxidoreductase-like protein [Frankiales bacterium]